MNKKLKPIPEFKSEAAERAFLKAHDSSDYVDWSKARRVSFPNLKASTRSISLRLPEPLLDRIRAHANKMDIPYQPLMKMWLSEKASELGVSSARNVAAVADGADRSTRRFRSPAPRARTRIDENTS